MKVDTAPQPEIKGKVLRAKSTRVDAEGNPIDRFATIRNKTAATLSSLADKIGILRRNHPTIDLQEELTEAGGIRKAEEAFANTTREALQAGMEKAPELTQEALLRRLADTKEQSGAIAFGDPKRGTQAILIPEGIDTFDGKMLVVATKSGFKAILVGADDPERESTETFIRDAITEANETGSMKTDSNMRNETLGYTTQPDPMTENFQPVDRITLAAANGTKQFSGLYTIDKGDQNAPRTYVVDMSNKLPLVAQAIDKSIQVKMQQA